MNVITQEFIDKARVRSADSTNPLVLAARIVSQMVQTGIPVTLDLETQEAIAAVRRGARNNENPAVWLAALLAELAETGMANGGGGSGGGGMTGAGEEYLPNVTGYTGGGATNLDGVTTVGVDVPNLYYFKHATEGGRIYLLRAGTDAEASPGIIRPDDYATTTNEKVFEAFI